MQTDAVEADPDDARQSDGPTATSPEPRPLRHALWLVPGLGLKLHLAWWWFELEPGRFFIQYALAVGATFAGSIGLYLVLHHRTRGVGHAWLALFCGLWFLVAGSPCMDAMLPVERIHFMRHRDEWSPTAQACMAGHSPPSRLGPYAVTVGSKPRAVYFTLGSFVSRNSWVYAFERPRPISQDPEDRAWRISGNWWFVHSN